MAENAIAQDAAAQQRVADAALQLQVVRAEHCQRIARGDGPGPGAELFDGDLADVREAVRRTCVSARDLAAVTVRCHTLDDFLPGHRLNEQMVADGVRMLSLFDTRGLGQDVRRVLASAERMPYYLCFGPLQMKLLDDRRVMLEGPLTSRGRSLLVLDDGAARAAARHYLRAVQSTAVRASTLTPASYGLSERQQVVARQLARGLGDEDIAAELGVSVRTVRYDIAGLLEALGARTRFAAGARYADLFGDDVTA